MGIFSQAKTETKKPTAKKEPQVKVAPKTVKAKKAATIRPVAKKEFSDAYKTLLRPLVTEKSVNLSSLQNQYAFAVAPKASKNEVKKTIQDLYGVKVLRVNILNTKGKKRRVGQHEGFKSGFRKALVFLAEGEKIEVISR